LSLLLDKIQGLFFLDSAMIRLQYFAGMLNIAGELAALLFLDQGSFAVIIDYNFVGTFLAILSGDVR
jgi:hypothetical protein